MIRHILQKTAREGNTDAGIYAECLDFAARGIVKTHFRTEKMDKLTEVSRRGTTMRCWDESRINY